LINGSGLFSFDALIVNWLNSNALSQRAKQIMRLERAYQTVSKEEAVSSQNQSGK
jgi:putative oxidoreductase